MGTRHIFVRDLRLEASIGIFDHERETPQTLVVSMTLEVGDHPVQDGKLSDVVDYRRPVEHAHAILAEGHIDFVESFADRLAAACLAERGVLAVTIRVEKPAAIPEAGAAGVEVMRTRESDSR